MITVFHEEESQTVLRETELKPGVLYIAAHSDGTPTEFHTCYIKTLNGTIIWFENRLEGNGINEALPFGRDGYFIEAPKGSKIVIENKESEKTK